MKFVLSSSALLALLFSSNFASAEDGSTGDSLGYTFLTGEQADPLHDGSILNAEDSRYDGSCLDQSKCLQVTIREVQRNCGSGSCEYTVCYTTVVGYHVVEEFWDKLFDERAEGESVSDSANAALDYIKDMCQQHPEAGVDYAGNMAVDYGDDSEAACPNTENSKGKGYWDEECINPEVADESTGITQYSDARFGDFCQTVSPGHTVHFMMHSKYGLDWNGENAEAVSCSGSAEVTSLFESDKWNPAKCAPSSQNGPYGQTYFPADDGSPGGTCSDAPEGEECVWSWTAPNLCYYEENLPTCYISQDSVDTVDTLCPGYSVVELFNSTEAPNEAPPRIPLHNIVHNNDGTVSFNIYNPYGNYSEPIDYSEGSATEEDMKYGPGGSHDFIDMFVVYPQANEIGNEVCDLEQAAGKCATDNTYTAKCRSDGVAVITIFASGMDSSSLAAEAVYGNGTDVFECCPKTYQPEEYFNKASTAAWTFLVHCDCPLEESDRRALREDVSSKFHNGELFDEKTKKMYNLL